MKAVGAFLALLALAACSQPPKLEDPVTSSARAPIALAVDEVRITNLAERPDEGTFKDRRASDMLAEATTEFLERRLLADGGTGWAQAEIIQASIIEKPLETTGGVKGAFVEEADSQLVADLTVRVGMVGASGIEEDAIDVTVGRTRQLSEKLDILEKSVAAQDLITDLLRQFDDYLTEAVNTNLANYKSF